MDKVKVYALFVWDENWFSDMELYKMEPEAQVEYANRLDWCKSKKMEIEEWDECGGIEFRCGECGMIVRLCEFELDASLFDGEYNLKSDVVLYACADVECDRYEQIRQVGLCNKDEASNYVRWWYASQHNYFRAVPEEQGLVRPAEEVERLLLSNIDDYQDYIQSDYGTYGGYYAGVGVKKIETIY